MKEITRNDLRRLRLKPGDFLLLRFSHAFTQEHLVELSRAIAERVGFPICVIQEFTRGDIQRLPRETVEHMRDMLTQELDKWPTQKPTQTNLRSTLTKRGSSSSRA